MGKSRRKQKSQKCMSNKRAVCIHVLYSPLLHKCKVSIEEMCILCTTIALSIYV